MIVQQVKVFHKNLNKKIFRKIIKLKNQEWKYSFKSHKNWIKKNFLSCDIHVLVFINRELSGYTALRQKKFLNNNKKYYYFDTHIVAKKFRGKILQNNIKVSTILMNEVFKIQRKAKKPLILLSKKKTFRYYEFHNWKKLKKENYHLKSRKKLFAFFYPKCKLTSNLKIKLDN